MYYHLLIIYPPEQRPFHVNTPVQLVQEVDKTGLVQLCNVMY